MSTPEPMGADRLPVIGEPMTAVQFFQVVRDGDLVTAETPRFHPVLHGYVHGLSPEREGCSIDHLPNARTYGLGLEINGRRGTTFTIHPRGGAR